MKKIFALLIIGLMIITYTQASSQMNTTNKTEINEWTGEIRIEGKDNTLWTGMITTGETTFLARNYETGEFNEYTISYPSVLGALDTAANIAGFSYVIEYWPSWDAFLLKSIGDDVDWWHYWVDQNSPNIGINAFELTQDHHEIVIGYSETYDGNALTISVDKSEVKKGENFTIHIGDFNGGSIGGAVINVGSENYTSNNDGKISASISEKGNYVICAEKEDFVRSEKINIQVKKTKQQLIPIPRILYDRFPLLATYLEHL
jgi:hypothetical protein